MIKFDDKYFQKIQFTKEQLEQYLLSAENDYKIADESLIPEVIFRFSYDALIKIGIVLIAKKGFKVRSRSGHHIKILEMMSKITTNDDVEKFGNQMRQMRNTGLYGGGYPITHKDSTEYRDFVGSVLAQAKQVLGVRF